MCDPITMGVIGLGVTAVSTVVSASGQKKAADATNDYFNTLASQAYEKIKDLREQGKLTRHEITTSAARESQGIEEKGRLILGAQRVTGAASGIGGGSVSMQDIAFDTAQKVALDEAMVRYEADKAKWTQGLREMYDVRDLERQAKAYKKAAKGAQISGDYNVASTILSGAAQVAFQGARLLGDYSTPSINKKDKDKKDKDKKDKD